MHRGQAINRIDARRQSIADGVRGLQDLEFVSSRPTSPQMKLTLDLLQYRIRSKTENISVSRPSSSDERCSKTSHSKIRPYSISSSVWNAIRTIHYHDLGFLPSGVQRIEPGT